MSALVSTLTDSTSEILQRAIRCVVILQNGRHGIGAGIIWHRDQNGNGLILTNSHIIGRSRSMHATLSDGAEHVAVLVDKDTSIDLALLRIESRDTPTALVADSRDLRIGQLVFAIGHPWGQRNMVTAGLISSLDKMRTNGRRSRDVEVIRSDARLAPGNSGGPLVNTNGAVIGITTMIVGGDQGIAIPSHLANEFIDKVIGE